MPSSGKKRFLYHAHATALAGTLRKPFSEHIQAQASSTLSVTGGISNNRIEKFRHRDLLSCEAAYTTAVGHAEDDVHTTLITATVEGLNVLHVLTADRVVTRIACRHRLDASQEPSILTVGSYFENLKIAGRPVEFEYNEDLLAAWDTFQKVREGMAKNAGQAADLQAVGGSIFRKIEAPLGLEVKDSSIYFPEFGNIYFGELYIWPNRRKLTMIRLELGCSHEGDVTICDGDGNGSSFPP
jgi:hypothetical protein